MKETLVNNLICGPHENVIKKETLVINLIGGPGSGKSTCASGIFYELKKLGINCELSLEFAKDKVWEESYSVLSDQLYVFGKQYHKLFRLKNKVDVIITDSPLIISIHYNKMTSNHFNNLVVEQYHTFNNLMYFIKRGETYQSEGRMQTLEESEMIDSDIKNILHTYDIDYTELQNTEAVNYIVEEVKKKLNLNKDFYKINKDFSENKNDVYQSEYCNGCVFFDGYDLCMHSENFGSIINVRKTYCKDNNLKKIRKFD
jgi:broad-specificity NMP kinase